MLKRKPSCDDFDNQSVGSDRGFESLVDCDGVCIRLSQCRQVVSSLTIAYPVPSVVG